MTEPRPNVVGVRFRNAGKIEYFHAAGMRLDAGESVIVETTRGPELARVVIAPDQVVVNELGKDDLKPILRLATEEDLRQADALAARAEELLPEAREVARDVDLQGRVEGAQFTLDGERLSFAVSGEERPEYRRFQRAASDRFGVKVDVRILGSRDRAKLAGGYGICGRELCCANWLQTFPSVSIRLAKDQELPLNPEKISGLCGRLLCCLSYEEEGYKEMRKSLPKMGQRCSTPTGEGKVISINVLKRQITLLVEGQRVEVGDRDLGLVVRWDPSSKSATPPPSISREEAIEQGLVEPDAFDEPEEPVAVAALPEAEPIVLSSGRAADAQPSGRGGGGRRGRRRGGGDGARSGGDRGRDRGRSGERPASEPPKGRVFRRAGAGDGAPKPAPQRSSSGEGAGEASAAPEGGGRRRRRRRGRRGGGGGSGSSSSGE